MSREIWFVDKRTNKDMEFEELDELICKVVNVEPHKTEWCRDWRAELTVDISYGRSYEQIEVALKAAGLWDNWLEPIVNYLKQNYYIKTRPWKRYRIVGQ